jgi:hypothetical protein
MNFTNNGILLTAIFVVFEMVVFITIYHDTEMNRNIGESTESQVKIDLNRFIIGVFLTILLIMFEIVAVLTIHHETMINSILNEIEQLPTRPMDIETGLETRNVRERITASFHLCDNA